MRVAQGNPPLAAPFLTSRTSLTVRFIARVYDLTAIPGLLKGCRQMTDIKGPAIDPEAFRVEGHCCGIRLPVLKTLTEEGLRFELTPEAKAELVAKGVLPADNGRDPPRTG
jgi:hypothetical protein